MVQNLAATSASVKLNAAHTTNGQRHVTMAVTLGDWDVDHGQLGSRLVCARMTVNTALAARPVLGHSPLATITLSSLKPQATHTRSSYAVP